MINKYQANQSLRTQDTIEFNFDNRAATEAYNEKIMQKDVPAGL